MGAGPQAANPIIRRSARRRVVVGDEGASEGESEVEMDVSHYGEELHVDLDALPDMILYDI